MAYVVYLVGFAGSGNITLAGAPLRHASGENPTRVPFEGAQRRARRQVPKLACLAYAVIMSFAVILGYGASGRGDGCDEL
jgi:hypothetical protein